MKLFSVFAALATLAATAQASRMSYKSPKGNDKWFSGRENNIEWDMSNIRGKGKVNAYLCRGGSVDITEIITTIAGE